MGDGFCPNCSKPYESGDEVCRYCGFILPFSTAVLTPGKLLRQRYEIQGMAHSGGMGYVYLAKDKNLYDRICVVKQVKEPVKSDTDRKRLEEEALRMSKLSHSNAAMILDQFVEGGYYFLVVQHISGKTLGQVLEDRRGPLTEEEVLGWAISMCDVVSYLHGKGVIHRDISPENIMLTDEGTIMFIDFGTMRELRQITSQKTAGIGKFGFTPPEQWQGHPVAQSDTFAIGATVYYLLTEYLPLSAEYQRVQKPQASDFRPSFPPIRQKNPDVSQELEAVLQEALQLDVAQRYSSAQQLGQVLEVQAEPAAPVQPRERPSHEPRLSIDTAGKKSRKRLPIVIGGSVGAFVLLFVSLLVMSGVFAPAPVLNVESGDISFNDLEPELASSAPESFAITNTGGGTLTGTLTSTKDWLDISPAEIGMSGNYEQKITVRVDTRGVSYGATETGYINITTNGGDQQVMVNLTMIKPPPPPSNVIFEDDFSDPTSGWSVGSGGLALGYAEYKNREYSLLATKKDSAAVGHNDELGRYSDFSLEVDARRLSKAEGNTYCAISFRQNILAGTMYVFGVSDDGFYCILKFYEGEDSILRDMTESVHINKGTSTNKLKVVCNGTRIDVYANGHKLDTVYDSSIAKGTAALWCGDKDACYHFDNFKLSKVD